MKHARSWALAGSVGLVVSFAAAAPAAAAAHKAPPPGRVALAGSLAPAKARAHPAGHVAAKSTVRFDLVLALRNPKGAKAFVRQVSSPGSARYRHYLTDAQWVTRFGPSAASVAKAESWLRQEGFSVGTVAKDRLLVAASGAAAAVERAFGVKLGYYHVNGHKVQLAQRRMTVPSSLAGVVSGTLGINQYVETTRLASDGHSPAGHAGVPAQEPAPPAGFRNPQPCSAFWGQKTDTKDSGQLYKPLTRPLPYDICGYKPAQLRGAYGLNRSVAGGNNGKGVTIAIVDAYDSPTLLADAQQYFRLNDPAHPVVSSRFTNLTPPVVDNEAACGASGWFDEQALDVEASHAMAPGANTLYVGAESCFDSDLLTALTTAVTSGASVVSDSWGDTLGDLLEDQAAKDAFDSTFMLAASTGVSVLFSSGDDGDNFADFGLTAPDYPPSSPFVTAVGGTTLEVNSRSVRQAEYGWSTAKQALCGPVAARNCGSATKPTGSLAWQAGGGGGTSYTYLQPSYQAGVVPTALALRNEALFGPIPLRVEPDISMDADAQSGMLIGLTQTFPSGVRYDQFKEGGTSLASPLLAGVIADTDQAAGASLGFLNPALYQASTRTPSAFRDIRPPANPDSAAVVRVDFANTINPSQGFLISARTINYAGPETFCDSTGNCATRNVTLTAGHGFDGLTGIGSVGKAFIRIMSRF